MAGWDDSGSPKFAAASSSSTSTARRCSSLSQRPRSISRQRSLQNGSDFFDCSASTNISQLGHRKLDWGLRLMSSSVGPSLGGRLGIVLAYPLRSRAQNTDVKLGRKSTNSRPSLAAPGSSPILYSDCDLNPEQCEHPAGESPVSVASWMAKVIDTSWGCLSHRAGQSGGRRPPLGLASCHG